MKLLIVTQTIDKSDPVLGFFHRWIEEFAKKFENITVICLGKGKHDLPQNVKVLSLGKEEGVSKFRYLLRFYKYIWAERRNYDSVLVHMNQEYVLLGAKHWWFMRKPIYMWRNHHAGNWLTDFATFFCKKVFCTSKYSYTAKYKKTVLMPIGVDLEAFRSADEMDRVPKSILFLGRIAQVKKPDLLVEALSEIKDIEWTARFIGDAQSADKNFHIKLEERAKALGLAGRIVFQKGIPNTETPKEYNKSEIFVNLSSSGMYDKTIIEAMACGCLVLASNENLRGEISDDFIFEADNKEELKAKLRHLLSYSDYDRQKAREVFKTFAGKHDIKALTENIYNIINND